MEIANQTKQYHSDKTFVYSCQYHVIFSPKYRRPVLVDDVAKRFKELVLDGQQEYKYEVLEMEVMPNHVHLLLDVNPKIGIYRVVNLIKGRTSHDLREEFKSLRTRLPTLWTRSKFVSTVGSVSLEVVKQYIENQRGK